MENKIEEDSSDSGRFSRSSTGDSNLPVDNFILEIDDDTKTNDSSFTHDEETSLENISVEQDESHVDDQQPKSKTPSTNKKKEMRGGRNKQTVISEEEQKAEEERIYKRLMHLLNTSKFFTSHLLKKMESSDLKQEKKSKNIKPATSSSTGEKESTTTTAGRSSRRVLTENVTNQTNARTKRPSPDDAEMKENAPKRRKKKIDIAISDVLTKEAVEEAHRQHMEKETDAEKKENEVEDSGSPEETKVTSLGFTVPKNQPNLLEGGALRDYQMKGLEWLKVLFENGVSGILADEMGLGKTIQVISLICHLIEMNVPGPFLIVVPLSTLSNWLQEFERFAPQVPVVLFYGNAEERYALRKKLTKPVKINDKMKSVMPVVVTSYQMPLMESQVLTGINWQFIIIDEGHRIKNKETQLNRVLTACHSHNRLLLTGTPLQNNLTELWTLLHFLLPDMFNDITTFNTWLDLNNAGKEAEKILQKEREEQMVSTLHQILFPFVLRRTKNDIALDIPPKKEVVVYCPMTEMQIELYEYVITKSLENKEIPVVDSDELPAKRKSSRSYRFYFQDKNSFDEEDDDFVYGSLRGATTKYKSQKRNEFFALKNLPKCKQWADRLKAGGKEVAFMERIKMQKPHMALLHIVNHPYLVNMPITCEKDKKYLYVSRDIIEASGKFLVLEALLAKLKQRGHKVLLFSTSCMLLDLMEEFMSMLNHTYVRLDGQCNLMDRKEDINAFNTDPNIFVFLISTRAGGLGINLTAADTVIIFNSDWNPMVDMQAQDRAHRIGQTKPVVVYRLTVAGTFDEKVVKCANNKKMMEKVVMKSDVFKLNEAPLLDLQELAALLKERKESSFVHSNPCGFSDEELDQLLDRSDLIESGKDLKVETRPANSKPSPRKSPRKVNAVEIVGEKQLKVSVEKLAI